MTVEFDNTANVLDQDVELLWGDLDGDNYISSTEVNFVYSSIGCERADGFFWSLDVNGDGLYPELADIDGDGEVTTDDYDLVSANIGEYGD